MAAHHDLIRTSGLPQTVFEEKDVFVDLLMHGYLDHHEDPFGINVDELPRPAYDALRDLADRYFAKGFAWFTPITLATDDQDALRERYGNLAGG